jgi:hypothetical protein
MARVWRVEVGTIKRAGSRPGAEGKHVLFNSKAYLLTCGADSEASNAVRCVWRRRPDLACGAAGIARPIPRMQQRHLTCTAAW